MRGKTQKYYSCTMEIHTWGSLILSYALSLSLFFEYRKICVWIRLKKINPMSQSCHAHLFFGACLIQQNSRFQFFWFFFFFSFLWTCLSQEKIRQTQQNTLNNRLLQLCVLSCILHPKSSSIFQSCERLKSDTSAAQTKKKKKRKNTC